MNAAVRQTRRRRVLPMPAGRDQEVETLLTMGGDLHAALERYVRTQRLVGVSWAGVGRLLGVSRQAARKRWRYLDDEPTAVSVNKRTGKVTGVVCVRTGASVGVLERRFAEADGAVPVGELRQWMSDDQARELGYGSAHEYAVEQRFERLCEESRRRQQAIEA